MPKKVLILLGSPRKKGNSATLAQRFGEGAEKAGAEVEAVYLHGMDIRPCAGCNACQEADDKHCGMDDEMQTLYPKLREADVLVFATPIYWFNVSAQTKLCMDRCYALIGPSGTVLAHKEYAFILTHGDAEPFTSGAQNAIRVFRDSFDYIGAKIAGFIYGSAGAAGEIRHNEALMEKAFELGRRVGALPE